MLVASCGVLHAVLGVWRGARWPCVGRLCAWPFGGPARELGEFGVLALDDVSRCEVLVDDVLGELVVVVGVWETVSHEFVAEGDELVVFETLGQKAGEVGVVGDCGDRDEDGSRWVG